MTAEVESYAIDTSRPDPGGTPTEVNVGVYVIDLDDINDKDQSFIANILIVATWTDKRLANTDKVQSYDLEDVWNPRLQIVNRQKMFNTLPDVVEVDTNGTVKYRQRFFGNLSQPLRLQKFPFDSQKLSISILAAGYTPEEVNLKILEDVGGIANNFSVPDWKVLGWNFEKMDFKYHPKQPSTELLVFSIQVKRYISFYFLKFILPLTLIMFMSWIVFWIDPAEYITQISVSITSMLTLIAYQFIVGSSLPEIPYMTRLDKLMVATIILVFLSFIEATVTAILYRRDKINLARSIDYYCRFIFPATYLVIFFLPYIVDLA